MRDLLKADKFPTRRHLMRDMIKAEIFPHEVSALMQVLRLVVTLFYRAKSK